MSYPQTPPYGAVVSLADHASMAMLEAPPSDRPITPDGDAMRDRQRSPAYSSLGGVVFENKLFGSLASVVPTILSPLERLLREAALSQGRTFISKDHYAAATAQSCIHLTRHQRSPVWIIIHLGILGEADVPEGFKFTPGALIRLHDTPLSTRDFGFEKPWIFGVVGKALYREIGYHFFELTAHLCVFTGDPHPINITKSIIAIPNILVHENAVLHGLERWSSIGQVCSTEIPLIYPPPRPWEDNPLWKHPEWYKIGQWARGERPDLPRAWSKYLSEA